MSCTRNKPFVPVSSLPFPVALSSRFGLYVILAAMIWSFCSQLCCSAAFLCWKSTQYFLHMWRNLIGKCVGDLKYRVVFSCYLFAAGLLLWACFDESEEGRAPWRADGWCLRRVEGDLLGWVPGIPSSSAEQPIWPQSLVSFFRKLWQNLGAFYCIYYSKAVLLLWFYKWHKAPPSRESLQWAKDRRKQGVTDIRVLK